MESKVSAEYILSKLPGVHNARVVQDEEGEMIEIHVLADVAKPAKQLARDIETAIYAATGVKIDRKIVSIAQIAIEGEGVPATKEEAYFQEDSQNYNFQFVSLESKATKKKLSITLTLEHEGRELTGASVIDLADDEKHMAVVEAAVAAVRDELPSFRIEFIEKFKYGLSEVVMAVGSCLVRGKRKREAGARLCRRDSLNDFAMVVLEVINKV